MPNGAASLERIWDKVNEIAEQGCAKREGDLRRIDSVEKSVDTIGKKLDKLFWTSLVTAGGIIMFLLKTFVAPMIAK